MSLNDILSKYEPLDGFSFDDLLCDLNKLCEDSQSSLCLKAEILAMSFSEGGFKEWNSFYGPTSSWTRKDTGELIHIPDKKDITSEILYYWLGRINKTDNPMLKMRYSGLVWDFGKLVTGIEPDFREVKTVFINSAYDAVKKDKLEHAIIGVEYLECAILRAISLNNKVLIDDGMNILIKYVSKYSEDKKPGIWALPLRLLIKHSKTIGAFEMSIICDNEDRFERLYKKCQDRGNETDAYAHLLIDEATLLADYYKLKNNNDKILDILSRTLEGVGQSFALRGAMWAQIMLEKMQDVYRRYNCDKQANRLYIEIQKLGSKVISEIIPNEISLPLDRKAINDYFDYLLQGSNKEVLDTYILEYLPRLSVEKERQKEENAKAPLLDLVHTVIYDWAGMPISHIGNGENGEKNKLSYGVYRRMLILSFLMQIHIEKMKEKGIYTYDSIIDRFKNSELIDDKQRIQLERGLKAYFDADYLVACHLLVPMFESSLRRLAALCGVEVMSANKEGGNEYKTMDVLLEKLKESKNIPDDVFIYFQNVFTDKFGWNIRNLISHGLLQSEAFNKTMADRIVHAFMTLTMIKVEPIEDDSNV